MLDKNLKIKLDRYLQGELSEQEKSAFKKLMEENTELREEYLFLKDTADALILLKRKELQAKFDQIEREEQQRLNDAFVPISRSQLPLSHPPTTSSSNTPKFLRKKSALLLALLIVIALLIGWYIVQN